MTDTPSPAVFYDGAATWLDTRSLAEPLLALCRTQTRSDGAYVYSLDKAGRQLSLVAWNGLRPTPVERFHADLAPEGADAWTEPRNPIACPASAWEDIRFRSLPEFVHHRFESVLSAAYVTSAQVVGFVNLCRRAAIPFGHDEAAFVVSIALALGDLLERSEALQEKARLTDRVAQLRRKLEDRKLVDRAKGILQDQLGLSEEDAYFRLRRTSRQRREPMGSIARRVIEDGFIPEARGLPR